MVGKEDIYRMLREEEIWHEITEHPAVYNMEEMAQIQLPYPEADAKNGGGHAAGPAQRRGQTGFLLPGRILLPAGGTENRRSPQ